MRLPTCLAVLVLSYITSAAPTTQIQARDTDFENLRGLTKIGRDQSGRKGDAPGKYFHESTFNPHYDGRFADKTLPHDLRLPKLQALVQTYLSTMHDLSIPTWLMHGSLLGWWWNRSIMPWDSDIDVQVDEESIKYLADYYNMTIHSFKLPGPDGKQENHNYLLEINPHYVDTSLNDKNNVIDARWIDTSTGLFIDITVVHHNKTEPRNMYCKDKHRFLEADIFPLRSSEFEGVPVKIPYAYAPLLEEEYGADSLTNTLYQGYEFQQTSMQWKLVQAQYECVDLVCIPPKKKDSE